MRSNAAEFYTYDKQRRDARYDANGNVLTATDQLSRTSRTHYDELNRPTRVVGPQDGAAYPVSRPPVRQTILPSRPPNFPRL